jgi:hypothetical protein
MEKRKHGSAEARVSTLVAEAPDVAAPRADACATLRRAGRLARPSMTARARARFGAPRLKNAVRSGNMLPSGDDRNTTQNGQIRCLRLRENGAADASPAPHPSWYMRGVEQDALSGSLRRVWVAADARKAILFAVLCPVPLGRCT